MDGTQMKSDSIIIRKLEDEIHGLNTQMASLVEQLEAAENNPHRQVQIQGEIASVSIQLLTLMRFHKSILDVV